jgi:hypothetical protein
MRIEANYIIQFFEGFYDVNQPLKGILLRIYTSLGFMKVHCIKYFS